MDPTLLTTPDFGIGPQAPYVARPAPLHYGDLFGADQGFSTVYQASSGYDVLNGVADADVSAIAGRVSAAAGARLNAPPPARNWMQTAGAGVLILAAAAYWFDRTSR